jgi:hypothetical protein
LLEASDFLLKIKVYDILASAIKRPTKEWKAKKVQPLTKFLMKPTTD